MGRLSISISTLCVCLLVAAALGAEPTWSVKKLPGSDDLPARMAAYYKPVEAAVKPAAPQYELPLDPSKLANPDFARMMYELRDEALAGRFNALLKANGFAAIEGRGADVGEFYKSLKNRGLPIFITSDSLLHLYHIQFDETLKDIEEREFFDDAAAMSKAIQTEALKLLESGEGDIKEAAKLLVGYASVPVVLLGQTDFAAEAAAAKAELASWPAQPDWQAQQAFQAKYAELLGALGKEGFLRGRGFGFDPTAVSAGLEKYLAAHPVKPAADAPGAPSAVADEVKAELGLIAAHQGFAPSPLLTYKEDYSQYVPRGHYTRSKRLKQYFKALMWYGRMTFLIRGRSDYDPKALVSMVEARRQTLAACMLAAMMENKLPDGRSLAQAWDRMYAVTAYYVGLADDLTPYEYRGAMRAAIGEAVASSSLTDAKRFFELRKALAELRKPEIYGGTGEQEGPPVTIANERTLAEALTLSQGMRLMGQRYIPDSFMMGKLVYPTVGAFEGEGQPFTLVETEGGAARGFPRGLDVMAVLGSDRARHWLKALGDDRYARYDETLAALRQRFGRIDRAGWNRNMYWSWLHTLDALLGEYGQGYPTFMRTDAWRDKQLSAALASWSQLRHDTILYAKQSYTMQATAMPAPPKMVEGYVEPAVEFYGRLLALTRMTRSGLDDMKVLDAKARGRLAALEKIVERLLALSKDELANKRLTKDDYAFIRGFGQQLQAAVAGVDQDGLETTIVADVHTDQNSGQVLEEGTGLLHSMVVVYPMPDGGLVAGVGPLLSHYEFKHPLSDRLTDEAWKEMVGSGRRPALPEWTKSFLAPGSPRRPGAGVRPGGVRPVPGVGRPTIRPQPMPR
jgi:hypothetical protein